MKNFRLLILLLSISMAFISCDKDEDEVAGVSGNKYETTYAKFEMTGSITLTMELKTKAELEENEIYSVIEFKSDGKFYTDDEMNGTWTQSGSTVTITSDGESFSGNLSGNVLTISTTETEDGDTTKITMKLTKM